MFAAVSSRRGHYPEMEAGWRMPRRAKITRRVLLPDAKYNSELVSKFINKIMERGKKGTRRADHV